MQSGTSSWWQGIDRESFSAEIARRFAVNKAAPPGRGGPALTKSMTKAHSSRGGRAANRGGGTATSCAWGHAYTPENTVIRGDGQRLCRACKALNQKRYKANRAARERLAG